MPRALTGAMQAWVLVCKASQCRRYEWRTELDTQSQGEFISKASYLAAKQNSHRLVGYGTLAPASSPAPSQLA
jgi:hypothetical protein